MLVEGIASGELIAAETTQIRFAALGANVFYFLSAPLMRLIQGDDPLESEALEFRRRAAIEYLGLPSLWTARMGRGLPQRCWRKLLYRAADSGRNWNRI